MAGQTQEASVANTSFPSAESSDPRLSLLSSAQKPITIPPSISSALASVLSPPPIQSQPPVHTPPRSLRWYSAHGSCASVLAVLKNTPSRPRSILRYSYAFSCFLSPCLDFHVKNLFCLVIFFSATS